MPIVLNSTTVLGSKIGVWKICESTSYFIQELGNIAIPEEKLEKRLLEKLAVRLLVNTILGNKEHQNIAYYESGKPYLKNSLYFVSFSHKLDYVSVILSSQKYTGIDLEEVCEKPLRLLAKFENENDLLDDKILSNIQRASLLWSAKECVYKVYGNKELDFKKHITIENKDKKIIGHVHKEKHQVNIPLDYHFFDNMVLVNTH
jgi:4'-phosphopantetheinyl transferase